jgi:hypothetical protein
MKMVFPSSCIFISAAASGTYECRCGEDDFDFVVNRLVVAFGLPRGLGPPLPLGSSAPTPTPPGPDALQQLTPLDSCLVTRHVSSEL